MGLSPSGPAIKCLTYSHVVQTSWRDTQAWLGIHHGKRSWPLKNKIKTFYIKIILSPVILILPSLTSSPRIRFKSASLIPAHLLSLLLSIWPPRLERIHKIRSLGDCGEMVISRIVSSNPEDHTSSYATVGLSL